MKENNQSPAWVVDPVLFRPDLDPIEGTSTKNGTVPAILKNL